MEYSGHLNLKLPSRDIDDAADINIISENFAKIDANAVTNDMVTSIYDPKNYEPISGAGVADAIKHSAPNIDYRSEAFPDVFSVADELAKLESENNARHDEITGAYAGIGNCVKYDEVAQSFNPESEQPISSKAVGDVYFGLTTEIVNAESSAVIRAKEYTDDKTSWKTVLDVTLTETKTQGGEPSLLLAMKNANAIANANKMRVFITFPVTQSWANGAFTLTAYLADETTKKYRVPILRESNVASSNNADFISSAYVYIADFTIDSNYRSYWAISPKPHNYFKAPVNSLTSSRLLSGGYPSSGILTYTPHLEIVPTSNTITFEKGTRVFAEVQ